MDSVDTLVASLVPEGKAKADLGDIDEDACRAIIDEVLGGEESTTAQHETAASLEFPSPPASGAPSVSWDIDPTTKIPEGHKSVWIYPAYSNDPFVYLTLNEESDLDDVRKTLFTKMGVTDEGVAKTCFYCFIGEKQHIVPLSAMKLFIFDMMKGENEFCFRLQDKTNRQSGYQANPSDPWHDDVYFDSYAWMQIHWEMLSDYKRCQAYWHALERFSEDVKDKVVLDVGCGTGILSIYALRAGAKKVYAIDASAIVVQAEMILNKNGCADKVELIHGKLEEIVLPVKEVDLIVSEWMGYFLLCESMLESVVYARDKWLAPGGKMFPCEAKLYLVPVNYAQYYNNKVKFFEDPVDGVDVTPLLPFAAEEFTSRTLRCFDLPVNEILVAEPETIKKIDIYTVTKQECRRTNRKFKFAIGRHQHTMFTWRHSPKGHSKSISLACSVDNWTPHEMSFQDNLWRVSLCLLPGTYQFKFIVDGNWVHDKYADTIECDGNINNVIVVAEPNRTHFTGFGSWFDVTFRGSNPAKPDIVLSTDPRQGYSTHWKQDICMFREPAPIKDERIIGTLQISQMRDYKRHFSVTIQPENKDDYPYQEWTV